MNYKIIDIHTHAWPLKIAQKARENLESVFKITLAAEPTVDALIGFMDKNSIDISVVCSVATAPNKVKSINDWVFSIRSERIKVFCAFHPYDENWLNELQRIKEKGDGIKLQPEFQNFYVDDEKIYPIYEKIEEYGIPVLFHCGHELSGTMVVHSSPRSMRKVVDKFPHLKIIAAHFGGFRLWDEVEKFLLGTDVYMDTAFFFGYLPDEKIKKLIEFHSPDRILFGTDFPLIDQKKDIGFLKTLDISENLKEKILYSNAKNLLRL
ncbi:MAG: amidohydrolase family protein [Candidatus Saelkia tenebricola]|nr:amidohydrolase family protein [Candidatus Saelkia tenebricola]